MKSEHAIWCTLVYFGNKYVTLYSVYVFANNFCQRLCDMAAGRQP